MGHYFLDRQYFLSTQYSSKEFSKRNFSRESEKEIWREKVQGPKKPAERSTSLAACPWKQLQTLTTSNKMLILVFKVKSCQKVSKSD